MKSFSKRLLAWYDRAGRHHLPWTRTRTPYRVWIAEVMLQQTQVGAVIPYFERFIARFPDCATLAAARQDEVLHLWSGLGYYARARHLHRAAQIIAADYDGEFPATLAAAMALPGVGRSTAGAVLALSAGQRHPILDGNVKRVLARHHAIDGWPNRPAVQKELWTLAEALTPKQRVADYTQAIMDLGAIVCTRTTPRCGECPVAHDCAALARDAVAEFPARRARRALPERRRAFLVIVDHGGAVLLEKRPPSGIWGGLWSFPEFAHGADYLAWCASLGLKVRGDFVSLPRIHHTFTHFHLRITPVIALLARRIHACMDSDRWLWYNKAAPAAVGLAKPVAQIISTLGQSPPRRVIRESHRALRETRTRSRRPANATLSR